MPHQAQSVTWERWRTAHAGDPAAQLLPHGVQAITRVRWRNAHDNPVRSVATP